MIKQRLLRLRADVLRGSAVVDSPRVRLLKAGVFSLLRPAIGLVMDGPSPEGHEEV